MVQDSRWFKFRLNDVYDFICNRFHREPLINENQHGQNARLTFIKTRGKHAPTDDKNRIKKVPNLGVLWSAAMAGCVSSREA